MLEQLRRNSRSFVIWILFGIIIAVFIINFGPQAHPGSLGCQYGKQPAIEVAGTDVSINSFRFAMNGLGGTGGGASQAAIRRQRAVDRLVERELLAQAAETQGFQVSNEWVNQTIAAGQFYILGQLSRVEDPEFWRSFEQLEGFASRLGLANVAQLADEQRREQLAEMMRQALARSVTVSEEEARQFYIHQNTKITADYVKFDVGRYKSALQLTDGDIQRYAAGHEADVKKLWEAEKTQWASEKPRVLARQIFIAKDRPKPAGAADGKKGDEKAADAKASGGKKDADGEKAPALERARAARARLASGADFAAVAREVSEDRTSRPLGGLLGWRPAESLGQGKEVVEAAKKLEAGKLSDVIESERGYHILRVEERSEKGLTYEQKRAELAARLAQDHYARAVARHDAEQALAQAKEKPLDQLFERKSPEAPKMPPGMGGQELPPEVLQQIEELKRQGIDLSAPPSGAPEQEEGEEPEAPETGPDPGPAPAPGSDDGKQGRLIVREGPNVLAQSGGASPPPAAPAKPSTPPAAAPASGDKAPAAAEQLPAAAVEKPPLQSVGPVSRMGDFLAGIGKSEKLVTDLFENVQAGKVAPQVYEIGDEGSGPESFAIVGLKAREEADAGKFDQSRGDIMQEMTYEKGVMRVAEWIKNRCEQASKSGAIKVSRELFAEEKEDGKSPPPGYQPCATLNELSVASQLRSRGADLFQ